ncbi:MAG: P-II family nitrogen regulator [Calditrichia bacterium]
MKMIIAYIKPHKLSKVTLALHRVEGLTGMSVADIRGFGRGKAKGAKDKIVQDLVDYVPHVKIEIICKDDLVEDIIRTIQENAHTGLKGDGKIYVLPVEDAVRIQTFDRGEQAV